MGIAIIYFSFLIFSETANAHKIITIAKYITELNPKTNAMDPPITGPTTVAMESVELKIPVDVECGLFSIKWKFPPINKNAHVPPTNAIKGIAIHQSVINDKPIKTKVVAPIPILNFVTFEMLILLAIEYIKTKAANVFDT